jgi:hypothetical protein
MCDAHAPLGMTGAMPSPKICRVGLERLVNSTFRRRSLGIVLVIPIQDVTMHRFLD